VRTRERPRGKRGKRGDHGGTRDAAEYVNASTLQVRDPLVSPPPERAAMIHSLAVCGN
jgi:hypothetical protein